MLRELPSSYLPVNTLVGLDSQLLTIFEGNSQQYVDFAAGYYEREVHVDNVAAPYLHKPLSTDLVQRLNPDLDIEALSDDIEEIGYPDVDAADG